MFPLSSAPAGGKPPASASAIVADRPRGYHDLKIDGRALDADVPVGEVLFSAPFTVGGIRWRIRCYPNGYPMSTSPTAVYSYTLPTEPRLWYELVLDEDVAKPVRARFKFSIEVEQQQKQQQQQQQQQQRKRSLFFLNSKPKVPKVPMVPKVPFEEFKSEGVESFEWKGDGYGGWNFRRSSLGELLRRHGADHFTIRCEVVVINGFRMEATPPPPPVSIPPSDLHENLSALLLSGKDADLVIQVGSETFAAHRCVLAARSPVFSAELYGMMREGAVDHNNSGAVRIDDMRADVFSHLLHFIYTDSLREETLEVPQPQKEEEATSMAQHLLVAADRYGMERLKLICEDKLCKNIVVGTVGTTLVLAEQHHCKRLKDACFEFIKAQRKLDVVVATEGFQHLAKSCPFVLFELIAKLGDD